MSEALMSTYTGKQVNPWDLKPEDICIEDIAHALSLKCRFNGHCREHYSVAQHSVICSKHCPEFPLDALMHDATEAYLPDVCRYVKPKLVGFNELEAAVHTAIAAKFGLQDPVPAAVKLIDDRLVLRELLDVMLGEEHPSNEHLDTLTPLEMVVQPITYPPNIERMFLDRYRQLTEVG